MSDKRFGDAQARTVKQREHGGVAREDPRLALLAGAQVGVGEPLGVRNVSGFGSVFATFGARTAESAATLPLPLRSRKRANERAPASARISERAPNTVRAPRRHEGAHILRRELREFLERRRAAEMVGEKGEELLDVAPIGFERLGRHPPLARGA